MVKKIIGAVVLICGAVAGTWYYAAQRFEEQAHVIITNLDAYKPYVTYSQAIIDKYKFQIHLTNVSIGTDSSGLPTPEGTQQIPPFRFDMNLQTTLFYNPFTKVLSICEADAAKGSNSYVIHHGNKTTTLKPIIEGNHPLIRIGFTEHPMLTHIDWTKFLKIIRLVEYTSGKIKLQNLSNNKDILSVDDISYNTFINIPHEDSAEKEYLVHFKGQYKNYLIHEEAVAIIKDVALTFNQETQFQKDLDHFLELYFGIYLNYPSSDAVNLKVIMPKDETSVLLAHLKEGRMPFAIEQIATIIPSIKLDLETNNNSAFGQAKSSYNIDYKKSSQEGKIAIHAEASLSDKLRLFMAKAFLHSLKNTNNPESGQPITTSEQDMVDMVPDLASISPLNLDFLLDVSAKDGPKIRDFHLNISAKNYQAEMKGEFTAPEVSASLEFKNYKQLMTDFMAYLDRLAQKGQSIETIPNTIATLKFTIMLADRIINQLGSYSTDGSTLSIKGSYNLSTGQSFVNGKPLEEIMGLLQQQMQTITPDAVPSGEQEKSLPSQAEPAQPAVPEEPIQQKQQKLMLEEDHQQSTQPSVAPQIQEEPMEPTPEDEVESQDLHPLLPPLETPGETPTTPTIPHQNS